MNSEKEDKKSEGFSLKQIRTFQGDVAEALRKQEASLVSIQRAEVTKRENKPQPKRESPPSIGKETLFFLGSFFLLILGAVGGWYTYNEFIRKTITPIVSPPENRFVPVSRESRPQIQSLSRATLLETIVNAKDQNISSGEIIQITPLSLGEGEEFRAITTAELLSSLGSRIPGNLFRTLSPVFMFGINGVPTNQEGVVGRGSFIVFGFSSFENAFPGMLSWERYLLADLGPILKDSAPTAEEIASQPPFIDLTDRNKDIRTLVVDGENVILYSFFDNFIIVSDNLTTMRTVFDRLTREKLSN